MSRVWVYVGGITWEDLRSYSWTHLSVFWLPTQEDVYMYKGSECGQPSIPGYLEKSCGSTRHPLRVCTTHSLYISEYCGASSVWSR